MTKEDLLNMKNNSKSFDTELFRLLIVGNQDRFVHLKDFSYELEKRGVKTKLIHDVNFLNKTFEINLKSRFNKNIQLKKILKEFQPDFVLFDRVSRLTDIISNQNIPTIILLRGNFWKEAKIAKEISNSKIKKIAIEKNLKLVENCYKKTSLILPISTYLLEEVKKRYPNNTIKLFPGDGRIPEKWNVIKSNQLKHPCIGLLQGLNVWGKTKEILLLKKVLSRFPNVTFYLAGSGTYEEKIIPELLQFENFVWLNNLKYPEKVIEFLSEIDIYVLLSGLEGLGQSIIEASLLKKPIIASNVGGIRDIIEDGKTGFLINDENELIEKISLYLNNKEMAEKIAMEGHTEIKNRFSWKILSEEFIEIVLLHSKKLIKKK